MQGREKSTKLLGIALVVIGIVLSLFLLLMSDNHAEGVWYVLMFSIWPVIIGIVVLLWKPEDGG